MTKEDVESFIRTNKKDSQLESMSFERCGGYDSDIEAVDYALSGVIKYKPKSGGPQETLCLPCAFASDLLQFPSVESKDEEKKKRARSS